MWYLHQFRRGRLGCPFVQLQKRRKDSFLYEFGLVSGRRFALIWSCCCFGMRNLVGKEGQVKYATGSRLRTRGAYWRLFQFRSQRQLKKGGDSLNAGVNNGKRRFEGLVCGMAVGWSTIQFLRLYYTPILGIPDDWLIQVKLYKFVIGTMLFVDLNNTTRDRNLIHHCAILESLPTHSNFYCWEEQSARKRSRMNSLKLFIIVYYDVM